MTPEEIIDGLRGVSTSLLDEEFTVSESQALDAAIAHLQPHTQPITPEGLEARGLERNGAFFGCSLQCGTKLHVPDRDAAGWAFLSLEGCDVVRFLPGVRTLGDVDDLVRMLEGGE